MQASSTPHARSEQLTLIWEYEPFPRGDGRMELVAKKPLSEMSVKCTARVLGVTPWTVTDLYRLGLINGRKPGARVLQRRDGKKSNAALRLDSESVLIYKAERDALG